MKKTIKKLELKKNVVAQLGKKDMAQVQGAGDTYSCIGECTSRPTIICYTGQIKCGIALTGACA